jgi:hypothetical protein
MDNTKDIKKMQSYIYLAIVLSIVGLGSSIVKNIVNERWAKSKTQVACIPADTTNAFPFVYAQTAANPIQSDALMKSFVEDYIHATQNEQIVNYHKLTNDGRYQDAMLSNARLKAIEMSLPGSIEEASNKLKYALSYDVFQNLKKGQAGWIFNIDDMLVFPLPRTGSTLVVIRGEFQMTFDRAKVSMPDELWGYREIWLYVNQGVPTQDSKGNFLNKYGLFVSRSVVNILTGEQKDKLSERNSEYYMKGSE